MSDKIRQLIDLIPRNPVCDSWGMSRGQPVDRYYIEAFLSSHASDIHGHVLEVGDDGYTRRFGADYVNQIDVIDIDDANPATTIIADIACAPEIPSNTFDCIVLTQVLVLIPDLKSAIETLIRIVRPGGVILATQPGISRVSSVPNEEGTWCWSVFPPSARWLFSSPLVNDRSLLIETYGNLLTATSFLWGLAQEDLSEDSFVENDPRFPVITAIRAVKKIDNGA